MRFEAGRWYCGQINEIGKSVIEQSLPPGGRGPFAPVLARQAAVRAPGAAIRFTEMLPTPEQCRLSDAEGNRYVSELRLVAVDRSARLR